MKSLVFSLALVALLGACNLDIAKRDYSGGSQSAALSSAAGVKWQYSKTTFTNSGNSLTYQFGRPNLTFGSDMKVSGSLGCNSASGTLKDLGDGTFKVEDMVTTFISCPDPVEGYLSDLLKSGFSMTATSDQLLLEGILGNEKIQVLFTK